MVGGTFIFLVWVRTDVRSACVRRRMWRLRQASREEKEAASTELGCGTEGAPSVGGQTVESHT